MTSKIGLSAFSHVGIVVRSVEDFWSSWGEILGIDDKVQRDVPQPQGKVQLFGERVDLPTANRIAFTRVAGLPIELIEPLSGESSAARWLEDHGPGVQHLGFWVDGFGEQMELLDADLTVTYSPASLVPELAGRPVKLQLAPGEVERPPFWAYLQLAPAGSTGWEIELLDAGFEAAYREYYGDFAYFPGDLP